MKILDRGTYKDSKICPVCKKSFVWRKKWAKNRDSVLYCSESCKKNKKNTNQT